jgi:maltooligosyltrehalose trehalohydrolase
MKQFDVWVPKAKRVELISGDQRIAMRSTPNGHWQVEAEAIEYAFSLDGGPPLPDPRSHWQPHGVHGSSRVVNHSAFRWKHADFVGVPLSSAVIYELHIGTFTPEGTFLSTVTKLPYLKLLGITHIELMPLAEFSGEWGWGYDGVDLYAPHHAYGSPDDLKTLIDACHGHGLAVLLDVVYNHLGPVGNYLPQFGPYFDEGQHTPWGAAVNFDEPEVRRYVLDNAKMWLHDYRFDGLRLDAVHALIDHSHKHILKELAEHVCPTLLIAETVNIEPRIVDDWGLDALWFDNFHHALHSLLTGETSGYYSPFGGFSPLAQAYREDQLQPHQLVVFMQNHDHVGNRAAGERMSVLVDRNRLKIGAAQTILSPFVPLLFQGEEWGAREPFQYFTNHADPWMAKLVTDGRRREFAAFGWKPEDIPDPQDPATFQRSKLDWSKQDPEVLAWYRQLIALRRSRR